MNNKPTEPNQLQRAPLLWCRALAIVFRDPRLPTIVRILVWFAVLYVICPFDFKSDFLPGGFIDDEIITPILLLMAFFSIPKGVLKDAKHLASKATCSFVCVALSSAPIAASEQGLPGPLEMGAPAQAAPFSATAVLAKVISAGNDSDSSNAAVSNDDDGDSAEGLIGRSSSSFQLKHDLPLVSTPFARKNGDLKEPLDSTVPRVVSRASYGFRQRICQTGDDPESSSRDFAIASPFGPSSTEGGFFFAYFFNSKG